MLPGTVRCRWLVVLLMASRGNAIISETDRRDGGMTAMRTAASPAIPVGALIVGGGRRPRHPLVAAATVNRTSR